MSLGLFGSSRRSAIAALMLALGSSCATSEEPNPEWPDGGSSGNIGGSPSLPGGATFGGSPEPSAGQDSGGPAGSSQGGSSGGTTPKGDGGATTAGKNNGAGGGIIGPGGSPSGGTSAGGRGGSQAGRGNGEGGATGGADGGVGGGVGGGNMGEGARGSCDWTGTCASKSCEMACPKTDGGDCAKRCGALITCVQKSSATCPTAQDPMCVKRTGPTSAENECTSEWETAGGSPTGNQPSAVATAYFECACDENVP